MKNFKNLLADLQDDATFRAKLANANTEAEANAVLADAGYSVTYADIAAHIKDKGVELSDEDLDAVTGGKNALKVVYANFEVAEAVEVMSELAKTEAVTSTGNTYTANAVAEGADIAASTYKTTL